MRDVTLMLELKQLRDAQAKLAQVATDAHMRAVAAERTLSAGVFGWWRQRRYEQHLANLRRVLNAKIEAREQAKQPATTSPIVAP